jgi:preprotein translocase subunit SecG
MYLLAGLAFLVVINVVIVILLARASGSDNLAATSAELP